MALLTKSLPGSAFAHHGVQQRYVDVCLSSPSSHIYMELQLCPRAASLVRPTSISRPLCTAVNASGGMSSWFDKLRLPLVHIIEEGRHEVCVINNNGMWHHTKVFVTNDCGWWHCMEVRVAKECH